MITTLKDTTSADIQRAIARARQSIGAASGMVFTLLVVTDAADFDDVVDACVTAGREHPSRIVVATRGSSRSDRMDAEVHVAEATPGEIIALRLHGELADHAASVLLPLLLPDSPVIAWWPGRAPEDLASDPVGALADRRITDAMADADPLAFLLARARALTPGDTDLTWTRITPWRALLASALDQHPVPVTAAVVHAARGNSAGLLLAAWLSVRLGLDVACHPSEGPGITEVVLSTEEGDIRLARTDGRMARVDGPRTPPTSVALRRRDVDALLTEELRRLDRDPAYTASLEHLLATVADADKE